MTVGQRHDPDRELFGQGLANLAAPLFGGVPATAAIARTAVNVRAGADQPSWRRSATPSSSPRSCCSPRRWSADIPLAALAGVLLATAVRMVEVGSLRGAGPGHPRRRAWCSC